MRESENREEKSDKRKRKERKKEKRRKVRGKGEAWLAMVDQARPAVAGGHGHQLMRVAPNPKTKGASLVHLDFLEF